MESAIAILNFHYVRPLRVSRFPRIKACELDEFRRNMQWLARNYSVVSIMELVAAIDEGVPLPDRVAVLTFDDGLADHFQYVLPILNELDLPAAFFPPAAAVLEKRVVDVHKVHFILASVGDPRDIAERLDEFVRAHGLGHPDEFHSLYLTPSSRDPAEVIYVKRMLQKGLPTEVRSQLASELFARFVSADEAAFAEELYLSLEQLRMMTHLGMTIGSHSYSHPWLSTLDEVGQVAEVEASLEFLDMVDVSIRERWVMCYPYGDFDALTIDIVRDRGCVFGLADRNGMYRREMDPRFDVPRVTQNDFQWA